MTSYNALKLLGSIVVAEAAGVLGSIFTIPAIPTWYATLPRPPLSPPAWIFGPVWTTLFFLMGIAAYLVWQNKFERPGVKVALYVYVIQLILNLLWSVLFFGLHNPTLAVIEIVFLWFATLATILVFNRISRLAALLLVPYILWVSFASYLNYSIATSYQADTNNHTACTMEAKQCSDGSYVGRTGTNCEFAKCPG